MVRNRSKSPDIWECFLSCSRRRWLSGLAPQKLQCPIIELLDAFVHRCVRRLLEDYKLGLVNRAGQSIGKASRGDHVVSSECYLCWRGDLRQLVLNVVCYHGIRLSEE